MEIGCYIFGRYVGVRAVCTSLPNDWDSGDVTSDPELADATTEGDTPRPMGFQP